MPEFVNLEGLTCLIKVGAEADQNYQNYILRGWYLATGHLSAPREERRHSAGQQSQFGWATMQAAARPCPWHGDAAWGCTVTLPAMPSPCPLSALQP